MKDIDKLFDKAYEIAIREISDKEELQFLLDFFSSTRAVIEASTTEMHILEQAIDTVCPNDLAKKVYIEATRRINIEVEKKIEEIISEDGFKTIIKGL